MANIPEQPEKIIKALSDCMALQVEQLQTLAAQHNPMQGVDLSEALACTIEMQGAIRRMMADLIHGPAPLEKSNEPPPPPAPPFVRLVNEDRPGAWAELKEFFKRSKFKK